MLYTALMKSDANRRHDNQKHYRFSKPNCFSSQLERSRHHFAHLSAQHKHILTLNQLVKPVFQTHASMSVSVAYYDEQGKLTIAAENQTAANHLSYLKQLFIDELKKIDLLTELADIIFIAITQPQPKQTEINNTKISLSDESRRLVAETAGMIRNNPSLSQALHQLSYKK